MEVLKQEEMVSLATKAVSLTQRKGADEVEAFVFQGLTARVNIERAQIAKSSRVVEKGLAIRAIANKAVGFSYTNILESEQTIEEAAHRALSSAKANKPDKDWHGLPTKRDFTPVKDTYDRKIAELDSESLVKIASRMLDTAKSQDSRVFPVDGGAGASYLCRALANSNGVEGYDHGTIAECSLAAIAREKGEVTPVCFEFEIQRKYDLRPEWVGSETARLAASALGAKSMKTKNTNLVFTQFSLQQLLHFTLISAVKADYVQREQSALKGKIGERIASQVVTILDDGLLEGGIRTWKFDGEGVPQQRTPIIEKGVLRNFIYDSYTAHKDGKKSTGNASRAGHRSTPKVEATNFRIRPGRKSPEQLVSELKEGLLVFYLQGAHSSNPASGEFSVVAAPAWKIDKGQISHATKTVMLAGNVFQTLKNITGLANNERKIGELVSPWIVAENVKVVGK